MEQKTILIVDDEPFFRDEVVAFLNNPAFATQGWLSAGLLVVIYLLLIKLVMSIRRLNIADSQMWFRCFGGSLAVWFMFGMTEICFTVYFFNGPLFIIMALCFGYLHSSASLDLIYHEEYWYEPQS